MRSPGPSARTSALAVVAVAAVTAAVVLGVTGSGGPGLAAAAGSAAADAAGSPSGTVTVSGVGTVQGVPDTLTASLGVHVTRSSVQSALDGIATDGARLVSALHRAGVPAKNVQTSSLQLYPHYDDNGHVRGYDASETVTARISPLAHAGSTLSTAVRAAGDAATVDGLGFDIVNDGALLRQARSAAFADARQRAEDYASLSGRSLGRVEKISETVQQSSPPMPYAEAMSAAAGAALKSVAIRPGQQPVTVSVTVVWALR